MSFPKLLISRTASSLLPRTVACSIAQRTYSYAAISIAATQNKTHTTTNNINNTCCFCGEFHQTPCVQTRNFSSSSSSALAINPDNHLIRVIKSEITCAEESDDHNQIDKIPDGFPFRIQDDPGMNTVLLERQFRGEVIKVVVHMPELVGNDEDENDNEDGDDNEEDKDENENDGSGTTIALVVSVSKGKNEPWLEFGCTAYKDEITIDSLIVKDPDTSEDDLAYEGPDFSDLDETLQKAFYKYLEDRAIKPSTTNFLYEYMTNKDNREYLTWLKTLMKFVKK